MNTYEIEIFNASTDDMNEIVAALSNDCIGFQVEGHSSLVEIDPTNDNVGRAVRIINELGFQTDEDQVEDDGDTCDSKTVYINISDRYGDAEPVTISDYQELNPNGIYEDGYGQIAEAQNS
jgi:hypothetical protein